MKKFLLLTIIIFAICTVKLNAQSITNTAWKGFFGNPINDTLFLHFKKDSFFVTNKNNDLLVRSFLKVSKDTITITDVEGEYMCPQADGIYKFAITGDNLSFTLINDPCDGRNAITDVKWIRLPEESKSK
jgi:hypothetical protein